MMDGIRNMKIIMNVALITALTLSISTNAIATGKGDASKGLEIASGVCAGCHSVDGNSVIPINPSLAGQLEEYTAKQLSDFKIDGDGEAKRTSPVMGSMVAALSEQDMKDLAAYYAQQETKPTIAADYDEDLMELGKILYLGGNLENEVPACSSCHSPNGEGIAPHYPQLSGQHADYTLAQLNAFNSGDRANDRNNVMRQVLTRMNMQEKRAVSLYISSLK